MPDGSERRLRAKVDPDRNRVAAVPAPEHLRSTFPGSATPTRSCSAGASPKDILIVGGGPVGVEFATICHAIGAKVTLLDRGARLMSMMDGEVVSRMHGSLFERLGRDRPARIHGRERRRDGWRPVGGSRSRPGETLCPDTLLFAAGRVANTDGLGLEAAGVELDVRGRIIVDENFRTSAPGDLRRRRRPRADPGVDRDGTRAGRRLPCVRHSVRRNGRSELRSRPIYGMPEISGAGLTEEQCREQGPRLRGWPRGLGLTPRGAIAGRGGLLKLIFLKDDRKLVGVHCIGDIASEIVGIGQMVIRCGGTLNTIANMSMNTPTYSYAYKYAAFDGLRRLATGNLAAPHGGSDDEPRQPAHARAYN